MVSATHGVVNCLRQCEKYQNTRHTIANFPRKSCCDVTSFNNRDKIFMIMVAR
jgi:hypothetical protein